MSIPRYKNEPDINAPRFRTTSWRYNLINRDLHKRFLKENPTIHIDYSDFKFINQQINEQIIEEVLYNREGVLLPKGLGRIWIGLFYPPKRNPHTTVSVYYDMRGKISWDFQYVIYRINNREFYSFSPHRTFKRTASKELLNNQERYGRINAMIALPEIYKRRKSELDEYNRINNKVCDKSSEDTEQSSEC